jgi:two-component system KDP operon response regulator KdpE
VETVCYRFASIRSQSFARRGWITNISLQTDTTMTASRITLLLIEDDTQIQRFLAAALEAHAYHLHIASTGGEGLRSAPVDQPDIILVDLGLPDMTGLEVIRSLRGWYDRPIIVISARDKEVDKVTALDTGADDYLSKPFGIGELLARLRVAERHTLQHRSDARSEPRIEIGAITIDLPSRRVWRDGSDLHLTPIEYQLLCVLARHRGKIVTHRQLLQDVWGAAYVQSPQYLRIYMRALRRKIEPDPARPIYLLTDVGVGYRMADGA